MTVFIDSNVPMYVAGAPHPFKEPSIRFMREVASGRIKAASDVEVLQEILHRYHYLRRLRDGFTVFEAFVQTVPHLHPIVLEDLLTAKRLLTRHESISPRDAIHAAVMLRLGLDTIISYDRHFDEVKAIRRIEP